MSMFYIVWPEKRNVPAKQIETWFSDAVANGEFNGYLDPTEITTVEQKAKALHSLGHITLAMGTP